MVPVNARGCRAPAVLLVLALGGVCRGWPQELPLWRTLAIATAWAGTGLLVASLVLMVRTPRLGAWLGGLEAMYRWHHRGGTTAYVLLLCHPLLLAVDDWAESPRRAWEAIAPWSQDWPVALGWGALVLLMAGLATSFAQRLSYRRWRGLHHLLGIAVVVGLLHVGTLLGNDGAVFAFAALAAAALAWRLLGSDLGLDASHYRVVTVTRRADRLVELALAPCAAPLQVAPGQFLLATFGDGRYYRGCGEFHPFTVSGIGGDGVLRVGIKALGPCSARLQTVEPGVPVRLQGPFGHFLADATATAQLWVAGGIGVTPFVAALRQGPPPRPVTLIYLYHHPRDAAFLDELRAFAAAAPGFQLLAVATGDALPELDALLAQVPGLAGRTVQICGPAGLVDAVRARLRARGVADAVIHHERFGFR